MKKLNRKSRTTKKDKLLRSRRAHTINAIKRASRANEATQKRNRINEVPEHFFTTETLALHLDVAPKTLENWRAKDFGPKPVKFGRLVRYDPADVAAWIEECKKKGEA